MKFLVDEDVPHDVATVMRRLRPAIDVLAMKDWRNGIFMAQPDPVWLPYALEDERVVISYDKNTIPPHIQQLKDAGKEYPGILIAYEPGLPRDNPVLLAKAVIAWYESYGHQLAPRNFLLGLEKKRKH